MKRIILAAAISLGCGTVSAQSLFFDNFDSETPGLNKAPSQWTVTDGTVDIIGAGTEHDFLPGNGYYIDLDGSSSDAGIMSTGLTFSAGTAYELSFDLAGSQRPDGANTVLYGIDLNSDSIVDFFSSATLPSTQGFTAFSLLFSSPVATTGRIIFDHLGGDNMGLLLDNVSVAVVPEPETYALLLAGLGLLGFVARRRA